ncbi:MAG: hypothetical protein EBZ47_05280 [Chlamydiae bacterium]|nr:hypothetical protein [Chlamydiota bacterium]
MIKIANCQFEWEMQQKMETDFLCSFNSHPLFTQLQFLSFLYCKTDDLILTSALPEKNYLKRLEGMGIQYGKSSLLPSTELLINSIDSWGYTPSLKKWAISKKLFFDMPDWELVKYIHSKEFSFTHSPKLPRAKLLSNMKETKQWIQEFEGKKVIKHPFGFSGRGLLFVSHTLDSVQETFLSQYFSSNLLMIAEPWVQRVFDFSSQWFIHKNKMIDYYGSTCCFNDEKGTYRKTIIYPDGNIEKKYQSFLADHKFHALNILKKIASLGFYGNIGIDAMIYLDKNHLQLHPIVEINARKTMGYVALMLQKHHFPHQSIAMSFNSRNREKNLLPNSVILPSGRERKLPKVLECQILS